MSQKLTYLTFLIGYFQAADKTSFRAQTPFLRSHSAVFINVFTSPRTASSDCAYLTLAPHPAPLRNSFFDMEFARLQNPLLQEYISSWYEL